MNRCVKPIENHGLYVSWFSAYSFLTRSLQAHDESTQCLNGYIIIPTIWPESVSIDFYEHVRILPYAHADDTANL